MTEPTETQQLEQRITEALVTIRREWDAMLPVGAPGRSPGGAKSAGIVGDNSAPVIVNGHPHWRADHIDDSHDIDRHTRLVSVRREVVTELAQWCRLVIADRPVTATAVNGSDVPAMCAFLERHAQWLSGHRDAEEAADRIAGCDTGCEAQGLTPSHSCHGLAQKVRKHTPPPIVDKPRKPRPHHIGTCPIEWEAEDDDGNPVMRECGGEVRAYPTPFDDPTREEQIKQPLPTCAKCGTEAHIDWWYREMYGKHGLSHLVTVDELIVVIAARLEYIATRGQIRVWKHRGKIDSAGKDSKGRTLYRHDDVIDAIHDDVEDLKAKRRVIA